ncbi:putative mitochondrial hypothetical protein [Leptomonas pyrrhocoris]|uniref:Uncharacterized protein n=1 Tax=Leptomonas pyrrhocoris TaxID=157538 RepID=A0A0M9FST5_LEPPY|nr:putative mitochondrial hypothetical protein [Leptomonas pyrrhocoris]KPA75136.1 putative mitochondrial hypothetical protein [Leptomonas pyrrhocoris]|eukprot:XP_015653575.1 putative mitochondrial hypothetical protein [Leptomonas pyrrhocoris]
MSGTPPPHSQGEPPAAAPPPLPLPILTEDDIAALPPAPSSPDSAVSSGVGTAAANAENEMVDSPTPLDLSPVHSEVSAPLPDKEGEEEGEGVETPDHGGHEHDDAMIDICEALAPVDAPLAMPESLPPPPSSTTSTASASPWSTLSSSPSSASFPIAGSPTAGESVETPDSPTVVDSASEPPDDVHDDEERLASPAHQQPRLIVGVAGAAESVLSEEAEAQSLRLSEERAAAALNRFSTSLHAKLVEQLIDDAAAAVETTLCSTIRQHGARVGALVAHNEALDAQLTSQAARMQCMESELAESIGKEVQRVLRVDLRAALRAQRTAAVSSSALVAPPSFDAQRTVREGGGEERQQQHDSDDASLARGNEEDSSNTSLQAHRDASIRSSHSVLGEEDEASEELPVSVEELIAAYLGTRSTINVLQREREEWRQNMAALHTSLLAATQENAVLRREVAQLRTSMVDLDTHRAVVQARAEAEHQCELLRLQLAKQSEEADVLAALVERLELTQPSRATMEDAAANAAAPQPSANEREARDEAAAVRKGPVWDVAMREMEEQVLIAANSRHLQEQLTKAEAELKKLEAERDASVAYAAALKEEGDVLRTDAQSLTYRNSVLSQQVASLLVKVENTTRAYRHLKESIAHKQQQQQQQGTSSLPTASSNGSNAQDRPLVPSNLLRSLPSTSSRRSNWLASRWPVISTSKSAIRSPDTTSSSLQQSAHAAGVGKSLNTAVLYGRPSTSDIRQLLYMPGASADVTFMRAPTEVEEGVQQRLSTYSASHVTVPSTLLSAASASSGHHRHASRRTRQTSLRQLGSATLEVDLECKPYLPASDQLSGSALGRPSAYTTLDPLNGTVTRRMGGEQLSVLQGGEGQGSEPSTSASSSIVASEDDVNADPQLLCLLDTLDKDESLDRFSVNSVSELVVRNQELVQQLYDATQRAEAAARQQQHQQAEHEKGRARSTVHGFASNQEPPASLAAPVATLLRHSETAAAPPRRSSVTPSRKRDRGDEGEWMSDADATKRNESNVAGHAQGRGSVGLVQSERGAGTGASSASSGTSPETEEAVEETDAAAAVEPWFLESASAAVTSMVDALVRRHEVRLTAVDTDVSSALLRALAAQRDADNAMHARTPSSGEGSTAAAAAASSAPSRAMAGCLRRLLQLCVRQSATLAEVAFNAAGQQQEMQKAVRETWTEVQMTLVRALQTSQRALTPSDSHHSRISNSGAETLVSSSLRASPSQRTRSETESASAGTAMTTTTERDDFRAEEQVTLLQELSSLLQTAAKKDGTLLHVYQAAQARQEARQNQQKERVARLLLKLERKRRLIKALRLRQAYVGVEASARGLSRAGQDADNHPSTTQSTAATAAAAAAATFRLSPQPGSPVHRTPPLLPMSLPSPTVPASPQPRRRHRHRSRTRAENDDLDAHTDRTSTSQSEGESDEDAANGDEAASLGIFRELQQQLAFSQATHRAVQEELDAEKLKHTTMLERMWVLETARDEAEAAKETLEKQVHEMIPRDSYDSVATDLKRVTSELEDRDTQLSVALTKNDALQEKIAVLQAQLEAQQLQAQTQRGQLEEVAHRREQRLATEEGRYRELHAQLSDVKQHAASLENVIALLRRELQEKAQTIRQREEVVEELKRQILMREDVQALLHRLYPGDSVVEANAQLVQRLSHTTTRLQVELAEVKQDLAHTQDELRQRELRVREAVQDRQAAEVRLQDAVARLAELQDDDEQHHHYHHDSTASTATSPTVVNSPTLANMDALFSVEGASVAALRHRVRYLTARMEAQAKDLAVMRDAEAAWKQRENELRRQVELMSADPISLCARKYGLTACATFADQLAEMQARQDVLRRSVATGEEERRRLQGQLEAALARAAETERQRDDATARVREMDAQLAEMQTESQDGKAAFALLEAQLQAEAAKHDELLQQQQQTLSDLHGTTSALSEVQTSLAACRTQRDQFLADNKQMISAVEKLEKALLQSEAEKEMAREALAQGLSSSSRRHRGGGHRGTAAERYQNQTSLTQDLSFSSILPSP